MFQFLKGAIKSVYYNHIVLLILMFQFLKGAIKRIAAGLTRRRPKPVSIP